MHQIPALPGRLIPYQAVGGAENMAIDQMLLESVETTGRSTLRLYGWADPTLSLGYFQSVDERWRHSHSSTLAVVRRATGGGAIVHHHELTYSIATLLDSSSIGANQILYDRVHQSMIRALADLGVSATTFGQSGCRLLGDCPFLCFMRRSDNDLVVSGYKVLGSAQRKSRRAILQHGSLLLGASEFAPELPGVSDLTGRSVTIDQIATRFTTHVQNQLSVADGPGVAWEAAGLTPTEQSRAEEILESRFGAAKWTDRR